jgi:hypothetical protein
MNDKQKVEHIAKMLGDLCQQTCEAVEADSLVMIVNKGKGSAVIAGGAPGVSNEDMCQKFKENAAKLIETVKNMENGSVKCDGNMYVQEGGKVTEKISLKRDEPPDICSFGL